MFVWDDVDMLLMLLVLFSSDSQSREAQFKLWF